MTVPTDQTCNMGAVPVLTPSVRISRHEGLLIHNSRQRNNAMVQIGMVVHAAVDQRHTNPCSGIVRLPCIFCINRSGGIIGRRCQGPI